MFTNLSYIYDENVTEMEKLTQQEEEAMQLIWRNRGGFIKELLDTMSGEKVPYTTLASTIKNLQRKGYVKAVKYANAYRYEAVIDEAEYKKLFMSGFVSDYFRNSYKELVSFFAKEEKISADELDEIVRMIKENKSN
ncbi:Predicted transcriptional regulator [Parapedobacter indicus]|uniref:Predicted transcriptional regulator n=2 Tax=Parapedobacter indicus TaxID=1477437 RepID=A0A1I3D6K8_9SPHI|nr:putative transcriptional regulator [Parapedobacter indicus]SFH82363.1 Predicted transcriptional regulator [Parapedobacter indicus]